MIETGPYASGEWMDDGRNNDDIDKCNFQQGLIIRPLRKVGDHVQGRHGDGSKSVVNIDTAEVKPFFAFKVTSTFGTIVIHYQPFAEHLPLAAKTAFQA